MPKENKNPNRTIWGKTLFFGKLGSEGPGPSWLENLFFLFIFGFLESFLVLGLWGPSWLDLFFCFFGFLESFLVFPLLQIWFLNIQGSAALGVPKYLFFSLARC